MRAGWRECSRCCAVCVCLLPPVAGGDGQLHMALPASVANVRDSGVGWDSAATE